MIRLLFPCICIIFLTIASCKNSVPEKEKQLRGLISKYPDSFLLQETLVQYFRDSGNYDQAIAETEAILNRDSMNARFLNIKGTLHFENSDTLPAIKAFEKAVSIDPRPEYIILLASLYAQTNNPMALSLADELSRYPSADVQLKSLFIKGLYFSFTGDNIKAIPFFDTCLKMDYRNMPAYRQKAICLYGLKKYTVALDVLRQAVTVQKSFDEGYYWKGRCYEKLGKRKEAIDSYQFALQIDPDYVEAKEALVRLQ